jgi:hypothetical protein
MNTEQNETFDKTIQEISDNLGVKLDPNAIKNEDRETLLNFIEANGSGDLSEEEINKVIDNMQDAIVLPEVIEKKEEIDSELGLKAEDLKALYSYVSGKGDKPQFLDRYLADNENKLKDFQHIMTLIRLSSIPQLAALEASIQQRLYSKDNISVMDAKDLSAASANLSKEISDILNTSIKAIEQMNAMGRVDSKYRALIDKLLVVPDDVLNQIEHLIENY